MTWPLLSSPVVVGLLKPDGDNEVRWKHGSICEDFSEIECAVFAVGGWADPYSNAIPRMLEGLNCPRKGLIAPLGSRISDACFAQSADRIPAGKSSLVGLLAKGKGHRNNVRTHASDMDPENPEEFRRSDQNPGLVKMTGLQKTLLPSIFSFTKME